MLTLNPISGRYHRCLSTLRPSRAAARRWSAAYAVLVMAHADALRAAGVNGDGAGERGRDQEFVSAITDNALWLIGTIATLAILVIGGLFFFGHSPRRRLRGQDRGRRGDHRVRARASPPEARRVRRLRSRRARRARGACASSRRHGRGRGRRCSRCGRRGRRRAHAADLFPVDDWLGDGIKKAGDVVLGPLKLGAKEIAQLLATIVGALADLLVPKSLVRAGRGRDHVAGAAAAGRRRRDAAAGRAGRCGCRTWPSCATR